MDVLGRPVLLHGVTAIPSGIARPQVARSAAGPTKTILRLLDRIKRMKGVWWMPWRQEAMKDVVRCDKPWGAANRL